MVQKPSHVFMPAHLNEEQIRAYRQRSLAGAELLDVSEHIGSCESCRSRLASPSEIAAGVTAIKTALTAEAGAAHLTYEQIEAYVDGSIAATGRETVAAHIRGCRSCAADLNEIRTLRLDLDMSGASRQAGTRWAALWKQLLGWRGGLVLAGAAACALLAVMIVRAPGSRNDNIAQGGPPPASQPAQLASVIRDGTRVISVTSGGQIEGLVASAEPYRAILQQALVTKRIDPAASLADLAASRGVLLGAPPEPARGKLLEPLATVVESQRPVFRWESIPGATYRVSVYDETYNVITGSGRISATEWQPSKSLRRGVRYSWQLNVRRNGEDFTVPAPPAPEARFRVLADAEEADISRARSQAADSHLVLGVLCARAGLLDQAAQELRALGRQNPDSQELAQLLASVYRLRGNAASR